MEILIGTDESLKGDTFGGIVVAGVRADDGQRTFLREIGAIDSKKLADRKITELAHKIKELPYYIISLKPIEYNILIEEIGLTNLLNRLHKECAEKLQIKGAKHIVDKYPGCNVGDIAITKAEDKYEEVAAASILARDSSLKQIAELSREAGMILPLGSTHVMDSVKRLKKEDLVRFTKVHFRNIKNLINKGNQE